MYEYHITEKLNKILKKLYKKDIVRYEATLSKINEVINSKNIDHYKNLGYTMKEFKRAHIDTSFVLIFKVDKNKGLIKFEDLQHHDYVYRNK